MARLAIFEVAEPLILKRTPMAGIAMDVARGIGGAYLKHETEQALRGLDQDGAAALFDRMQRALGNGPSTSRVWKWLEANLV
jgi:hypothetical protein